jgi:hypothetical protein
LQHRESHCSIALIHACAEEVRAGRIDEQGAVRVLTVTVRDLFTGAGPG